MQVLKQNDCFIGGTEKQYKELAKINESDTKYFISNCLIRGNKLTFAEFTERLKNTVGI
jgi:hypothetical protein